MNIIHSIMRYILILVVTVIAAAAVAQVPRTISYQGYIEQNGIAANGKHLLHITLYDSLSGGNIVFEESQEAVINTGIFNIAIGSVALIPITVAFDKQYYLGLSIDGTAEFSPRTMLSSVPYSLTSQTAELANGLTANATGVVTSINELSGAVRITGDSITDVTENGNDLIIHAVGSGTGGGISLIKSPDSTISILNPLGPNVSIDVADNSITSAKLANGSVTLSKLGQDGAKIGQILKWNGTSWNVANDSSGNNYQAGQGIIINGTTISATGGLPAGTVTNSTLRWSGAAWIENTNLTSDASGNTKINGATTIGDGVGADNINLKPGSGSITVQGFGTGVIKSSIVGVLSSGQVDLASDITGVLPVTHGGTATATLPIGQILLGNGTNPITTATLTAGNGIAITPNANSITIINTDTLRQWRLLGNANTNSATNFLGTTDANPIVFRTSNIERARLDANGNLGIGTNTPQQALDIKNGNMLLSNSANAGNLIIASPGGATTTSITTSAQTTNIVYKLPPAVGSTNQVLAITNLAGNTASLGWTNAGTSGNDWQLTGNNGTVDGTNFVGTTDNIPFTIRVNNLRAIRIDPLQLSNATVSITMGSSGNSISNGKAGATISGGGTTVEPNTITDDFSTISGGTGNSAGGPSAVVGGGEENQATYAYNAIGGGFNNITTGAESTIPGGAYLKLGPLSFGYNGVNYALGNNLTDLSAFSGISYLGNVNLWLGNVDNTARQLRFYEPNSSLTYSGTNFSSFQAGTQSADIIYTLPTSQPSSNQVLSATATTGTGPYNVSLGWADPNAGGNDWLLTGNSGTTAGTNFIGTTDSQAFEIHVYDSDGSNKGTKRVMRYEPGLQGPTIVGGYYGNGTGNSPYVYEGVVTISGGGFAGHPNIAGYSYGTIGGGYGNYVLNTATIAGGGDNNASGSGASIGGGTFNGALGNYATISGGNADTIKPSTLGSTIAGGWVNTINGDFSVISGGENNYVSGKFSTVPGGGHLHLSGDYSFGFHAGTNSTDSVSISTSNIAFFGNTNLWLGNTNNTASQLRFYDAQNGGINFPGATTNFSSFQAGTQSADIIYTLPTSQPTSNQVLSATTITGSGPYSVTLGWVDPSSNSGYIIYGPTSTQATLTPRTTPLFNIAYISTAADASAAGATITSSSGAAGNFGATGLTVSATGKGTGTTTGISVSATGGTGTVRAIDATGRVNINSTSSYDIGGFRFLWTGANSSTQNTLVGYTANTTNAATLNTFVGYHSGMSNDNGSYNTFVGAESGLNNNGSSGEQNTYIGAESGYSNTSGMQNTFLGDHTGYLNTTGQFNVFLGDQAGYSNTTSGNNTIIGTEAGWQSTGANNTIVGSQSGWSLKTGTSNIMMGLLSGYYDTSGISNVMVGTSAGEYNYAGSYDAYLGDHSGIYDTAGTKNLMLGYLSLPVNGHLSNSSAIGAYAKVGASNSMVLGSINGVNSANSDVNVGIGTTTPLQKFNLENGNVLLSRIGANAPDTLQLQGTSTGYSTFTAGAQGTTTINYTLPTSQPSANQVLSATTIAGSGPYNVALGWTNNGGNAWTLIGNSGTTAGTNFIGTTDNTAFEIHVYDGDANTNHGSKRAMRYEYGVNCPTITGGYHGNTNAGDGAVIAGGGFTAGINSISSTGTLAAISGGRANTITGQYSSIAGGDNNTISSYDGFIGAGYDNTIDYENLAATAIIEDAVISGGIQNEIKGTYSAIAGGVHLKLSDNSFGYNASKDVTGIGGADLTTGAGPFNNVAYLGNVDLWLGNTSSFGSRQLRFYQNNSGSNYSASTYYTAFQAPSSFSSSSITYTLPADAPAANGNLLLATSGAASTWSWSTGLVWDNTNSRLGINTTSPSHPLHSVNSATTDEIAAVYGVATASTSNQAIGLWGDASNTGTTNTGSIGVLATGNGNTSAGQTNVALQINDGEFAMGRTTEAPGTGTDVNAATAGTAYSAEGPSGVVELTLGGAGNLVTAAPTANNIQAVGTITINNRYCQAGSIVLVNIVSMTDDGNAPDPRDAAFILNVDNTSSGSFSVRVKMIPTATNAANYTANDKIKVGYMIVNKSR